MPIRRTQIEDHRGRSAKLFRSGLALWQYPGEQTISREQWKIIKRDISNRADLYTYGWVRWWKFAEDIGLVCVLAVITYLTLSSISLVGWKPHFSHWGMLFFVPFFGWQVIDRRLRSYPHNTPIYLVVPSLLEHALCPQCGYSLRDTPPEADGCRICPECGAAWKMPQRSPEPVS